MGPYRKSRTPRLPLAVVLGLLAAASGLAETATVSGMWEGSWQTGTSSGRLVLRLTQSGESVTGTYDSGGGPAGTLSGVPVHGTFRDGRLVLTATRGGERSFDGTLAGEWISGTYWGKRAVKSFAVRRQPTPR